MAWVSPPPPSTVVFGPIASRVERLRADRKAFSKFQSGGGAYRIEFDVSPTESQLRQICSLHVKGTFAKGVAVEGSGSNLMAIEFAKCKIHDITFPQLESRSKEQLKLQVELRPEGDTKLIIAKRAAAPSIGARSGSPATCDASLTVDGKPCPFNITVEPCSPNGGGPVSIEIRGGKWESFVQGLVYTNGSYRAKQVVLSISHGSVKMKLLDVYIRVNGPVATFIGRASRLD